MASRLFTKRASRSLLHPQVAVPGLKRGRRYVGDPKKSEVDPESADAGVEEVAKQLGDAAEQFARRIVELLSSPSSGRWMTAKAAAKYSGFPVERVRQWVRDGKIEHVRVGREIRVKESAIDAFFNGKRAPSRGASLASRVISPRVLEILGGGEG